MAEEKSAAADALLAFGPKPGAAEAEGTSEYEDEFDAAAADAFPDLAGDPARLASFKQAIESCVQKAMKKK